MARGFSDKARHRASTARKIKNRFGQAAYVAYRDRGVIPAGLDDPLPSSTNPDLTERIRTLVKRQSPRQRGITISEFFSHGPNRDKSALIARPPDALSKSISISKLIPTQGAVDVGRLSEIALKAELHEPYVIQEGDKFYVIDGHHNIAIAKLRGHSKIVARIEDRSDRDPSQKQADARPDAPPTHAPTDPSEFLKSLDAGEIVRDLNGQRIRVQKKIPGGLRIHDNKAGARDMTWARLESLGLKREERDDSGPAAQRIGELRDEAKALGIDTTDLKTKKQLEVAIGEKLDGSDKAIAQIEPQLAADAKDLQDFSSDQPWRSLAMMKAFWTNDDWIAEEKLDGVRLKMHFTSEGVRVDSRRRDKKTRRFSEKSQNFGHLLKLDVPELHGTVLDSEGMIPAESGTLPSGVKFRGSLAVSTAATNASPSVSRQIQHQFGNMRFWTFDILRYKGEDVSGKPYSERRKLLEKVLAQLHELNPDTADYVHVTTQATGEEKLSFFEGIIDSGGEGVIFKQLSAPYKEGKRDKAWQKLKKFTEIDAVVKGFVPGKAGNEGMVGALELAVFIDGKWIPIAAVSQLTGEQRKEMSAPDGSLKPEFYDKVVTFRGQELTKKGRFRHAVLVTFREDKNPEDADGYEVRQELAALDVI